MDAHGGCHLAGTAAADVPQEDAEQLSVVQ